MIILYADEHYFSAELVGMELRLALGVLDISADGVRKVVVNILRSPIDMEALHAKTTATLRDASNDTADLFECDDVDHI
jgi:hypothetical protein